MKRLLEFLWSGCWHEWETESMCKIFDSGSKGIDIVSGTTLPIGRKYVLRCKKCGELKTFLDY